MIAEAHARSPIYIPGSCSRCPALVANRRRIVQGYGPLEARVLFVGEAPGYKGGDLTGVPFTRDRSGVRFQQVLITLGLSDETDPRVEHPRLHCFVTNVVRCNPPSNRAPSRVEVDNCMPYLWQELELLRPQIVVPIGAVAARAIFLRLLDRSPPSMIQAHAHVFHGDGVIIVPMRHPARSSNHELVRFVAVMRPLLR